MDYVPLTTQRGTLLLTKRTEGQILLVVDCLQFKRKITRGKIQKQGQ